MKEWYSETTAARYERRAKGMAGIMVALAALTLAACIFLCTRVNTGNAAVLLIGTMALSTLGGWAVLLLWCFGYRPARAQVGHIRGLLEGEEEWLTGCLKLLEGAFQIPGSIVVRKVRLDTDGEALTLNLNARHAGQLPAPGARVKVVVVRKFITAVEVCRDENA